jgi:hypothetical protein
MTKTNVRIGAFEIDDAELSGENQGDRTLRIPCKSDPDLCMQLDAWDAETSVPAILDGEHSVPNGFTFLPGKNTLTGLVFADVLTRLPPAPVVRARKTSPLPLPVSCGQC